MAHSRGIHESNGADLAVGPISANELVVRSGTDLVGHTTAIARNAALKATLYNALSPLSQKGDILTHNGAAPTIQPVGADGRVPTANSLATLGWEWAVPQFQERNFIINGGFDVTQRVPAALTNVAGATTTGRAFTADRWGLTVGNVTTPQFQQVDAMGAPETGLKARYYSRFKQLTNSGKHFISQVLPAADIAVLRGRTVSVSFNGKCTVNGAKNLRFGLIQLTSAGTVDTMPATFISAMNAASTDPTLGTNLSYITPLAAGLNATISGSACSTAVISSQWFTSVATWVVPTDCKNLVVAIWTDDVMAANDDLLLSEIALYDGGAVVEWTPRNTELQRCLRFFAKTFPQGTAPAQSGGLAGAYRCPVVTAGAVATSLVGQWRFPVPMFKTPTLTFYNPSAANAFARNATLGTDATATTAIDASADEVGVNATGLAAWAVGNDARVHITADAEI